MRGRETIETTYALTNCKVVTPEAVVEGCVVVVEGERISRLTSKSDLSKPMQRKDLAGAYLTPGFIDLQVNGGGGVLFNDEPTVDGLEKIVKAHRRFGTTALLPTYLTGPAEGMEQAAQAVQRYLETGLRGVLGIHFEGPFISQARAGVHDKVHIREPRERERMLMGNASGLGLLVTLAPEVAGLEFIRWLTQKGVVVSLGHSEATYETALAAFESGARCVTHLFNGMVPMHHRLPGLVGAALAHNDSWIGIIADGQHSHFGALKVALRAKGLHRAILVTDAMPPVGVGEDNFSIGGREVNVDSGVCRVDGGVLAGTVLDMASAVRNSVKELGASLEEAVLMASTHPAMLLGLASDVGRIKAGYRADMVVLDENLEVLGVIVGGEFWDYS